MVEKQINYYKYQYKTINRQVIKYKTCNDIYGNKMSPLYVYLFKPKAIYIF